MNLSSMTDELRKLAADNTHFSWNESLDKEFNKLKGIKNNKELSIGASQRNKKRIDKIGSYGSSE